MDEERQPIIPPGNQQGNNQLQPATEVQRTQQLIDLARSRNSSRTCVIDIVNRGSLRDLFHPIVFINAGHNSGTPDTTVPSGSESVSVFEKRAHILGGTSGLVSYAYAIVDKVQRRFAVFWQVPLVGPNQFGICWTTVDETGANTDDKIEKLKRTRMEETYKDFLQQTFHSEDDFKITKTRQGLFASPIVVSLNITSTTDNASVRATMGDNIHAIFKVEFSDMN